MGVQACARFGKDLRGEKAHGGLVRGALRSRSLRYAEDESDMVGLRHEICAEWHDRREEEIVQLVVVGTPGESSAMAKTVGIPAAAAATLLVSGLVSDVGVITPTVRSIYQPLLAMLESEN